MAKGTAIDEQQRTWIVVGITLLAALVLIFIFYSPFRGVLLGKVAAGGVCKANSDCDAGLYCAATLTCQKIPFSCVRSFAGANGCAATLTIDSTGSDGLFTTRDTLAGGTADSITLDSRCNVNKDSTIVTCDYDSGVSTKAISYGVITTTTATVTGICVGTISGEAVTADITGDASCPQEVCTDGIDNDADTFIDCADADCLKKVGGANGELCEATEASCSDKFDNDADGLTDCSDKDCDAAPVCKDSDLDGVNDATDVCITTGEAGKVDADGSWWKDDDNNCCLSITEYTNLKLDFKLGNLPSLSIEDYTEMKYDYKNSLNGIKCVV